MNNISGKTLTTWGLEPGAWFKDAIPLANQMRDEGKTDRQIIDHLFTLRVMPAVTEGIPLRTNNFSFGQFIEPEGEDEIQNTASVIAHMDALMRTPTIERGAVMPDACPSGSQMGTIPVGGVVATKDAIHPGFHSADVCCSMAISVFKRGVDVGPVLDAAMKVTHFGPGGRPVAAWHHAELNRLIDLFQHNPFLAGLEKYAIEHFMTQGDGNHFFYTGEVESTGQTAIVTHHGSRGLGGQVYKRGKAAAERHTRIVAGRVPAHNAWIKADSEQGQHYWNALQIVRQWTKLNHYAIHDETAMVLGNAVVDRFWNEHNFVFQKSDGLFYHAKGATPSYTGFADDNRGLTLIPMNMSQPILVASSLVNNDEALNFAPHGAGRNLSRTAHIKRLIEEFGGDARGLSPFNVAEIMERETKGLDVRFYTGRPDVSELPSAYKNAEQVQRQIEKFGLARIEDRIMPRGSIMAGEMPWQRNKKKPKAEALAAS
ncbi:RtcB family protein [Pararhizobium qamdonense]|uniref:RtcB family protein n=1 Tax=Pararhizobium qamdonense TaxID=3031126 RepID=UPI002E1C3FA0